MKEAVKASSITTEPVEWLWREHLPKGMICVVAGKPDQGKGLFAAHVAADVTQDGGKVLYSAAEDDPRRITVPRLEAAQADLDNVLLWNFRLPADMDAMVEKIVAEEIELVVIDPLASHLSSGVSRHSDNIRVVTDPLRLIADTTNVTFLIVEHSLKRASKFMHPLGLIGGTGSGLPAAARAAYLFGSDPDDADRKLLCNVKLNVGEKPKSLEFQIDVDETIDNAAPFLLPKGESELDASVFLIEGEAGGTSDEDPTKPTARSEAAEWIAFLLHDQGGTMLARDVLRDARIAGLATNTVKRAAKDMGIEKNPPNGGRNCTWTLPTALSELVEESQQKGGDA
jgi:hypothetical protein